MEHKLLERKSSKKYEISKDFFRENSSHSYSRHNSITIPDVKIGLDNIQTMKITKLASSILLNPRESVMLRLAS